MADTTIKKNQKADIPTKNGNKYSYQYVDIAQIHDYLEQNNMKYYQFIQNINGNDYIFTRRYIDGKWEDEALQGCRVVDSTLFGNDNPAQKQGSAITYARRYSLLMAFGLATEDDDANSLNNFHKQEEKKEMTLEQAQNYEISFGKYKGMKLVQVINIDYNYIDWLEQNGKDDIKKAIQLIKQVQTPPKQTPPKREMPLENQFNELPF